MGAEQKNEANSGNQAPGDGEPQRKLWWFKQPVPIDRFTGWLVAWTALLFVATIINAVILGITDHTLHTTLEANNRAWLAIVNARLENMPAKDLPVLAQVIYKNLGQSPALSVGYRMFGQTLPADSQMPTDDPCGDLGGGRLTVFPGYEYAVGFPHGHEMFANDDVLTGKSALFLRGCFRYITYERRRETQFCYFLRHDGPNWYWQDCGNYAD